MLFKVFVVLGAISLLGGFAHCQTAASNQNEQLLKLLTSMMSSSGGSGGSGDAAKMTESQLMQQMLTSMMGGGNAAAKPNENQAMQQLLTSMMSGSGASNQNQNQNQMMQQLLMSMMGGSANSNQNQQMLQLLTSMMANNGNADLSKMNENQMMQQLLMAMLSSGTDAAKTNSNQAMQQLLMSMMGGNAAQDSSKTNENQMMQMLMLSMMNSGGSDASKSSNVDQMMQQLLTGMMANSGASSTPSNQNNQMMQLLMSMMGNGASSSQNQLMQQMLMTMMGSSSSNTAAASSNSNQNQLMQMLMLSMMTKEETKAPSTCMAAQNKAKAENSELAGWTEMLKADSWKNLFRKDDDYMRFTDMVKYVEKSTQGDWLSVFLQQMTSDTWLMKIGEEIVSVVEEDQGLKDNLMKMIQGNKDMLKFAQKAIEWMKMQDFSMATPTIQKIVDIFLSMDLKPAELDAAWYDNYMSWVDCTFGKEGELSSIMRTIGMLSKSDDMLVPLFKNMIGKRDEYLPMKINVTLELIFGGLNRCNKTVELTGQSLLNTFYLVTGKKQFCTSESFQTMERSSSITQKMGMFVKAFGQITNTTPNMWKITIINEKGQVVTKDADMMYMPKDGDVIRCIFSDQ